MDLKADHLSKSEYIKKVKNSVAKCLKHLEPVCASKVLNISMPETPEKAYKDLIETQARFIEQRNKLRLELSSVLKYEEKLSYVVTPTRCYTIQKTPILRLIKKDDLDKHFLTPGLRCKSKNFEFVSNIDSFIQNCIEVKQQNKNMMKKLPRIERILKSGYGKISEAVETMKEQSSPDPIRSRYLRKLLKDIKEINT